MVNLLNSAFVKRAFDIILAFSIFVIFSPLFLFIMLFIGISSGKPIIYKQARMGKDNKPFILYKFRTMKQNKFGPLWTDEEDERIAPGGRFLRQTHLDELPQLINIIRGNISFVGPRPERLELVEIYRHLPDYEHRHSIKPGLTGWAQLNYKASTSLEEAKEKLKYDIHYIQNRSFVLDLKIFLKTIRHLFFPFL